VADFFCGSGTAAVTAARLGRRFLGGDVAWRAVHTTRARLLAEVKEPFDLLKVEGYPAYMQAGKVESGNQPSTFSFQQNRNKIFVGESAELDYWEVDPAWDGCVFRSAVQAVRPLRKGLLPSELSLPESLAGKTTCIRAVSVAGEVNQFVLS